ncbi:MAG: transcription antitermination factor NusB [Candidatus Kapabacteria bacterium]|nr:transcription antitermination factor NusB [Candidatus Kapabacteria bacterium]
MKKKREDIFPLSHTKCIYGSRHLVRQKVLQILTAIEVSNADLESVFEHIFYRDFNFDDIETEKDKLLTQEQILEIESDTPIIWRDDDIDFAKKLIQSTISIKDEVQQYIQEITEHWSIERISLIDKILIEMAVAEFVSFPEIPVKVSISEAMEIGKIFSTDKSAQFINGILDKILLILKDKNKINKIGRGLIDS